MTYDYFSDRELGPRPRVREDIPLSAWGGLVALVTARVKDGSFGQAYPDGCDDSGSAVCGTDALAFALALGAEIPEIDWPLRSDAVPPTMAVLDRKIARAERRYYHGHFHHHHLEFDVARGRSDLRRDVNSILARNGLAYEMGADGRVTRTVPELFSEPLLGARFQTGDADLNALLEAARAKYLHPDLAVRMESLEKLWDAWERLKTLEPGANKRASTKALLDRAATATDFRAVLEEDALALTEVGYDFRIRHSEVGKKSIGQSEHVDYLFQRMFTLVHLLLRRTRRGG